MTDNGDTCYYFAYGSNLNPDRMKSREAWFTERSLGKLNDFEFLFNKKRKNGTAAANIRTRRGSIVYGALYRCTTNTLKTLDYYEGVHKGHYKRENVDVFLDGGLSVTAVTYVGLPDSCDDSLNTINKDYLQHILCGHDILPKEYVSWIESFSSWVVAPDDVEEIKAIEASNEK